MDFQPAQYMEFAKNLDISRAECVLAFSGIECPFTLEELGIDSRVFKEGKFHPYGNADLKEAVAQRYKVPPDNVLIPGGGTSLPNFLIGAALLKPGDRVLMEHPTYEPLESTIAFSGAQIVHFSRRFENRCDLDLDELVRLMRPPVKLIVLTRLHNPSGRDIPEKSLLQLAEKAEAINAYVLMDEVYLDFLPPERIRVSASLHPRLITTASLTKVYGFGGLRVGWAIGPRDIIWNCWRINNLLGVNPPTIPEQIALALFCNGSLDRIGDWVRRRAAENLAKLDHFLGNQPNLEWVKPDGGIMALLRLKSGRDSGPLVEHLRDAYKTLVMPGRFFGQNDSFRLGFGIGPDQLLEGLKRLGAALNEMRA
jgi:aspartate/methionine/tyrosine aminotransferase